MEKLKCAIGFLTILPMSSNVKTEEEFTGIMVYFPVVALILGSIYYLLTKLAYYFTGNELFCGIIYTVMSIILTGGLHYDGLADSFDGLFCGKDKSSILEIMQDSRIGAFGVLGIVINILLKLGIVCIFIEKSMIEFLVFSVIFSRTMQVFYAYKGKYAKEKGMGNLFIGKIGFELMAKTFFVSIAITIVLSVFFEDFQPYFTIITVVITTFIAFIAMMILKKKIDKKIGGITGDILGLVAEVSETIYLYIMIMVAFSIIKFISF